DRSTEAYGVTVLKRGWHKSIRIYECGEGHTSLELRVLTKHERSHTNRHGHESDRFYLYIRSLFRGCTAQFDDRTPNLKIVHLEKDFARHAHHLRPVNFGNGCNRRRASLGYDHALGFEVLGKC